MPNILDLPLAKRPIKLDDYNIDLDAAEEVDIVWGDYCVDIRIANVVLARFHDSEIEEYFVRREQALTPWLSVADAVEKGFDFEAAPFWIVLSITGSADVLPACGIAVEGLDEKWEGAAEDIAFKPILEICTPEVLEACKRVEVWNG